MNLIKLLSLTVILSACMGSNGEKLGEIFGVTKGQSNMIGGGCISAEPVDQTRIKLNYSFPSQVTVGKIHANNAEVASIPNPGSGEIIIGNFLEGVNYIFRCYGVVNGVTRESEVTATAKVINRLAPQFNGLVNAELKTPGYVQLNWEEPGAASPGIAALTSYFKIRTFRGPAINPSLEILPAQNAFLGQNVFTLGKFGDELQLTFHVSACTIDHICDNNTITRTLTIPQYMAPINTKAVRALGVLGSTNNGVSEVQIDLNWDHTANYGGLKKRHLYVTENPEHNGDIAKFSLYKTENIITYNPASSIIFASAEEGKTYFFIVRGEDGANQMDENNNVVSLTVPDLTPANFDGIKSLSLGENKENQIVISFNSISHEPSEVVNYRLYYTSTTHASGLIPANACTSTSAQTINFSAQLVQANSQNVQLTFSEAQPRRVYNLCLKAVDLSGNISKTTTNGTITTIDTTAPIFAGAQSDTLVFYDANTSTPNTLLVRFPTSTSSDVSLYQINFQLKNLETGAITNVAKNFTKDLFLQKCTASLCSVKYSLSDGIFGENQEIKVQISACDDGLSLPQGQTNCSQTSSYSNAVQTGDMTGPQFYAQTLNITSTVEGRASLSWTNPASASSNGLYAPSQLSYFKAYLVNVETDNYQSLLQRNNASTVFRIDCNNGICPTNFNIDGLEPFSQLSFTIIAFDQTGNASPSFDVAQLAKQIQIKDSTAPNFNGSTLSYNSSNFRVSAPISFDNQFVGTNKIYYQLFFKRTADYSAVELINPEAVTGVLTSTMFEYQTYKQSNAPSINLTFDVPISSMSQGDYFYTICAYDESQNRACINRSAMLTINDLVAPVIKVAEIRSTINQLNLKTEIEKKWMVSIAVEDSTTPTSQLTVKLFQKFSALESDSATKNDTDISNQLQPLDGLGKTISSGINALPNKQNWYAHYLIQVNDGYNTVERKISTSFTTGITISDFRPRSLKGGAVNTLAIKGTGFSHSSVHGITSTVSIGGTNCTTLDYVSENYLLCKIQPNTSGNLLVVIQDDIGSSAISSINTDASDTCAAGGPGTSSNPTVICTPTQFIALQNDTTNGFTGTGKYFRLGANLDFSGVNYNPTSSWGIKGTTISNIEASGVPYNFDGDGFFISNLTIGTVASGVTYSAIFPQISTGSLKLGNLNLYNTVNIQNPTSTRHAFLIANSATTGSLLFENIGIFKKTIDSSAQLLVDSSIVGGMIGYASGPVYFKNVDVNFNLDINGHNTGANAQAGGLLGSGLYVASINGAKAKVVFNWKHPTSTVGLNVVGGFVGQARITCTIPQCLFSNLKSDFTINTRGANQVGGFFGRADSMRGFIIQDSESKLSINQVTQNNFQTNAIGGIIGRLFSFTSANGGVLGNHDILRTKVSNLSLSVNQTQNSLSSFWGIGGMIGVHLNSIGSPLRIRNSSVTNSTITYSGYQLIGGFVGNISTNSSDTPTFTRILDIQDSFTQIKVTGYSSNGLSAGGFVGGNYLNSTAGGSNPDYVFTRSYAYNCYEGDTTGIGGLVAHDTQFAGILVQSTNSFYNTNHTTQGCNGVSSSYGNQGGQYNRNTLNTAATFSGFDFNSVWKMSSNQLGPVLY